MQFGVYVPNFGDYADVGLLGEMAQLAEASGWDGFFLWDHVALPWAVPCVDAWIALTAVALRTNRIRFGPLVTPLPRRRPAKVARETVTLDHLSGGRLILGVGSGGNIVEEWAGLGEATSARTRGAMLDEGLALLAALWSGEPVRFDGTFYRVHETQFLPRPVQRPRIPIWVGGAWPGAAPFQRAARWDGAFPVSADPAPEAGLTPDDLRAVGAAVAAARSDGRPFDLVHVGTTSGQDPQRDAAAVQAYADAGVTWWLEALHERRGSREAMLARIRSGPPNLTMPRVPIREASLARQS